MSAYTARAVRWEHGWEIHVDGVGVTQCRTLADAERMARDLVATMLGGEGTDYTVTVRTDLGGLEDEAAAVRARREQVAQETRETAAASRAVARKLRDAGLSVTDIAIVLGVSRGRVSQLLGEKAA